MKYKSIILSIFLALLFVQCSEEGDKVIEVYPAPSWAFSSAGNAMEPDWQKPASNLYPTSMTAVLCLTPYLEADWAEGDKMAAFIGGECRGVADAIVRDGKPYYMLQIKADEGETGKVSFYYYSHKNTYEYSVPNALPYEVDGVYGTIDDPEYPGFEASGRYPVGMQVAFKVTGVDYIPSPDDKVAAFVGDDCRGVAVFDGDVFSMAVRGKMDGEAIDIRYYNQETQNYYVGKGAFRMKSGGTFGTAEEPETIALQWSEPAPSDIKALAWNGGTLIQEEGR